MVHARAVGANQEIKKVIDEENRRAFLPSDYAFRAGNWFQRIQERPTFEPAFIKWMAEELSAEMHENARQSWPMIRRLLQID